MKKIFIWQPEIQKNRLHDSIYTLLYLYMTHMHIQGVARLTVQSIKGDRPCQNKQFSLYKYRVGKEMEDHERTLCLKQINYLSFAELIILMPFFERCQTM